MSPTPVARKFFTTHLLKWHYEENNRDLPWKKEKDPYKIWLSEIILQQTRAEQGTPYYEKFILQYPNVHLLAQAPDDDVFRLWQGLGYYNRCRNLLAAARSISAERNGKFPDTYEDLLQLKGVGAYTAAAISSFAFHLPHAVVDGNVYRVLSRYFGISLAIDSNAGKAHFQQLATLLLDKDRPADYNQAIMDFGSAVCKPKLPACASCILNVKCIAFQKDLTTVLPIKEKKMIVKERHFTYILINVGEELYIQQRQNKDIWQNLYEYYLIESDLPYKKTKEWLLIAPYIAAQSALLYSKRQRLTHQLIKSDFYQVTLKSKPPELRSGIWVKKELLKNYAFPLTILSFYDIIKYF